MHVRWVVIAAAEGQEISKEHRFGSADQLWTGDGCCSFQMQSFNSTIALVRACRYNDRLFVHEADGYNMVTRAVVVVLPPNC